MSTDIPTVIWWKGKEIRELTRAELEHAFLELGRLYQETQQSLMNSHRRALEGIRRP